MIDLILLSTYIATFYAGIYCGKKYGGFKASVRAGVDQVKSWL